MADLPAQQGPSSPWDEVRADVPNMILVRVITTARRLQFWIAIGRTEKNLERGAEVHDGMTVLLPRVAHPGRADAERDAIIEQYDKSWHAHKKEKPCPSSSPKPNANA